MNYEGLPIRCPHCRKTDWNETTAAFSPGQFVTGGMVRLQEKWRKRGMLRGFLDGCKQFQITCGFCQGKLVKKDGQLEVLGLPAEPEPTPQPEPEPESNPEPQIEVDPPEAQEEQPPADESPLQALYREVKAYMKENPQADWWTIHRQVKNPYDRWGDLQKAMKRFEIKERRHG